MRRPQTSRLLPCSMAASTLLIAMTPRPAAAWEKNKGDLEMTYLAFHSVSLRDGGGDDFSEFEELLSYFMTDRNPDGYGNPEGFVRFGLHYHFNPVGSKFFKLKEGARPPYKYSDFVFRSGVVARNLDQAAERYPQAHITLSIMAGHCYESAFSEFLNADPETHFMRNQYDQPVEFADDDGCTSAYPFTPAVIAGHRNLYLQALMLNARRIMEEIDAWTDEHPEIVVAGIGLGGPTVFPHGTSNKKVDTRWADYREDFIESFRRYAEEQYGGDFPAFLYDMGIPDHVYADFSEVDPPRFDPVSVNPECTDWMPGCVSRGDWDTLGDLDNPYFALWQEFRGVQISAHYRAFAAMADETGLSEFHLYSTQGVAWEHADSYLVKGSTLNTIDPTLTGLQPGLNLFNEKTNDLNRIRQLRQLAVKSGSWAGAASFQYNPGGPCEVIRHKDGTKERLCSPEGYSVEEYLNRLYMTAGRGDVPRSRSRFRILNVMGDDKENGDAIRDNMRRALKAYLSNQMQID